MTEKELNAILFYMGDQETVDKQIYRGGNKAYNTINALLHKGIQNEIDLFKENRNIEIYDSEHLKSYIELILDIYYAMTKSKQTNEYLTTYKIDRYSTIENLKKNGIIEGFFSTCKYGYLEEYAHIKKDVILLEIIRNIDVPNLDFEEIFKDKYSKSNEAEILIPFNTNIESIKEVELTNEEKIKYTDMNNNPPVGKYILTLSKPNLNYDTYERINYNYLISDDTVDRVKNCLIEIKNTYSLNNENLEFYCNFKDKLHAYLRKEIIKKSC